MRAWFISPEGEGRVLLGLVLVAGACLAWGIWHSPDPPSLTGTYTTVQEGEFVDAGRPATTCSFLRVTASRVRVSGLSPQPLLLQFTASDRGRVVSEGSTPYQVFRVLDGGAKVTLSSTGERLVLSRLSEVPKYLS